MGIQKYKEHIALFLMKLKGTYDGAYTYKGSEYMSIYPYVSYFDGTERYTNGNLISRGYYIQSQRDDTNYITPLGDWLKKR